MDRFVSAKQMQAKLEHGQMSRCAGSSPVVVPPSKALCNQLLGGEALHELDDLEVGHSRNLGVLLQVEVLLRKEDTLCSSTACLLDAYRTGDGLLPCASCNEIQYYAEGTQKLWADI